jgi:hypothetical protein
MSEHSGVTGMTPEQGRPDHLFKRRLWAVWFRFRNPGVSI